MKSNTGERKMLLSIVFFASWIFWETKRNAPWTSGCNIFPNNQCITNQRW